MSYPQNSLGPSLDAIRFAVVGLITLFIFRRIAWAVVLTRLTTLLTLGIDWITKAYWITFAHQLSPICLNGY